MANDPETHAAILADAARLADGGNLEAAADALRSSLEIDFSQEVLDVLATLDRAFNGELDREVAAAAVEELAESDFDLEIVVAEPPAEVAAPDSAPSQATDDEERVAAKESQKVETPAPPETAAAKPASATDAPRPADEPSAGSQDDTPSVSADAAGKQPFSLDGSDEASDKATPGRSSAQSTRPQPPVSSPLGSAFQTQPRRPARGMSLDDLKDMLSRSGAQPPVRDPKPSRTTKVQAPAKEADPRPEQGEPSLDKTQHGMVPLETESDEFERRPSHDSKVRFRGAVPPPPSHRRQSMSPVKAQPSAPAATEEKAGESSDDAFDFFGSVSPGASHLDVEPEVLTEGTLADAIAAPAGRPAASPAKLSESAKTPAHPSPALHSEEDHAQAQGAFADMMAAARAEAARAEAGDRHRATASVAAVTTGEHESASDEASQAEARDPNLDSGAATPASGTPVVSTDAFQTGRLRPVQDETTRRQPTSELLDRVRVLLGRGDLASAKQLVDEVLTTDPGHGEALTLARNINDRLTMLRMSALEPMDRVPRPDVGAVAGAALNPKSMFLLSMADGSSSLQDLVDLSGMPAAEASEILVELIEKGVLRF